ncbi:consortin-like [Xyrauchen texanus]|uniref:consortin-like n=1 Tax=Xyrauchen texanus TaxID=154827 RepID=UPI002242BC3E|nr:consortin-like [Xyrauchen texanus]XP_051954034.1 consortin-like [Xyrauchen texanus]
MEDSETKESLRWTEMTRRTQTTEDVINPCLTVSDVTQNKLKETDEMDLDTVKHNSESRSSLERSQNNIKSHSLSLDQGTFSGLVPSGPSPFLLASLQSLIEDNDHMLLPHSLHQIAEAYFLEKDYQWAVEFLQLEKLYHERLLSNLASIQEQWESQCRVGVQTKSISPLNANGMDREREHMESLSHFCRTHQRPNLPAEKKMLQNSPPHVTEHRGSKQEQALVNSSGRENWVEAKQVPEEDCEEEDEEDLEADECWNEDLQEEVEIGSQGPVDELAKLIQVEEMFPSDGLVSILKKRVCVRGAESLNSAPDKDLTMRKVRFREPDDAFDQDESARKSCLVLLLLCLITVVISISGTALYCLIGGAYSNVCVDFSHNVHFYFGTIQRGLDALTQWLSSGAS